MKTFTYTYVKARAEAVVDQVDMFLQYAGIVEESRKRILAGVEGRWLQDIGVYLARNGKRLLEAEIGVDWDLHSDLAKLTPTIRTDLPGWEQGTAPEVRVIGRRFGQRAQSLGVEPSYWVRFTKDVYDNPPRHREYCSIVGVSYGVAPPEWETAPAERTLELLDLQEVHTALRSSWDEKL